MSLTGLGIATGLVLSIPAGWNAVGWGILGVGLTFIGVVMAPLGLDWFVDSASVAVPVGVVMALAIAGAYGFYRRRGAQDTSM
jgi:hypothetical protein